VRANLVTFFAIVAIAFAFYRQALGMPWSPARVLGLAIATPALLLLLTARIQLGRAFSLRAKASNLVTTGLYSRIRNPIYVFSALLIFGIIIWSGRLWFLVVLVILIPIQMYRVRKESGALEARFGEEYRHYKQKTWF
jgi:protein-S-isoprenylcysteine O-methyltransferase Ste14